MKQPINSIGIVASDSCKKNGKGKRWYHLRKFIEAYYPVLEHYHIATTESTAKIINEALAQVKKQSKAKAKLDINVLGDRFRGVVKLASMVARRDVNRVLMFQDPSDLDIERPERYALLRNCNISGSKLHINASAHLWALYECKRYGIKQKRPYYITPVNSQPLKETIAFIAHDTEKPRMARFALHYRDVIRRFPRLIATSGTKKYIDDFLKNSIPPRDRLSRSKY